MNNNNKKMTVIKKKEKALKAAGMKTAAGNGTKGGKAKSQQRSAARSGEGCGADRAEGEGEGGGQPGAPLPKAPPARFFLLRCRWGNASGGRAPRPPPAPAHPNPPPPHRTEPPEPPPSAPQPRTHRPRSLRLCPSAAQTSERRGVGRGGRVGGPCPQSSGGCGAPRAHTCRPRWGGGGPALPPAPLSPT